jgi:hypothetical protein
MDETYEIGNRIGAKVAFLGLFVAAVLSAQLVVAMRSRVVLSEPIALAHAGLSVRMPEGNGWRSAKRWEYQQNGFTIGSTYVPGPSRPTGAARCRYLSPAETTSPQIRFEQQERALEGKIVQTGRIDTHMAPAIPATVTVDWVHIQQPGAWFNTFFGTVKLPHNARLEIEVHESTGDADLAEHVFRRIAESVSITDSPLLDAGARIIAEMKDKGIVGFLDNQNRQSLFLIRDERSGDILGFTSDVLVDTGPGSELNIQAASLYYIKGLFVHEEVASFQSDNRFDRFVWRFDRFAWKSAGIAAQTDGAAISLDEAGILTITTFGEEPKESSYYVGASAVPEVLIEQLIAQMLDSGKKEIVVDIIEAGGRVTPTHIIQIEPEEAAAKKGAAHEVKLTPLDGRGFYQSVYLNERKGISGGLLQREETYRFESIDPEDAAKLFPGRAEYILQGDKLKKYLDERKE